MVNSRRFSLLVLILVGMAIAGCAWSPEAKKARATSNGDRYFGEAKYKEAIIEYKNVLQIDGKNAHAFEHLGYSHYLLGEMQQSFRYLSKAKELAPENVQVRLKLGTIYLMGRKADEARGEAEFVLEKEPKNLDGLLLFAGAANTKEEVENALQRLVGALPDFAEKAKFQLALGVLYARKGDATGAEQAFKEAVSKEPKSAEAHTALGNLYLAKRDAEQAEEEFKTAAELASIGSQEQIKLADFYLLIGKSDQAKTVLQETVSKAPEFLPAWHRIAQIAFTERNYDEAIKALDPVFKKNQADPEGKFLRGRISLAQGKNAEAVQDFQGILKLNPSAVQARIQLASAYAQSGDVLKAKGELKEALTVDPNSSEAGLALAELEIRTRGFQQAIDQLKKIVDRQPRLPIAHVLLGTAYFGNGEFDNAANAFRGAMALAPKDPRGPFLLGQVLEASGKTTEAKKQYEAAVVLGPAYLEPLARLAAHDIYEKKPGHAIERIKLQISLVPESAALYSLLGKTQLAIGEKEQAEVSLNKAIEMEPRLSDAYTVLGRIYAESGKDDQALGKLEDAIQKNPKEASALMLSGIIHQKKGNLAKAREAYEKVVALNPQFTPAANNLAYMYAAYGGDLDKAFQLALKAHEAAPEDSGISDTLGWILYKRGEYQWALGLLKEASAKVQDNPEMLFHLGMVQHKLKENESAKLNLTKAIGSGADFPGIEDGKLALKELQ